MASRTGLVCLLAAAMAATAGAEEPGTAEAAAPVATQQTQQTQQTQRPQETQAAPDVAQGAREAAGTAADAAGAVPEAKPAQPAQDAAVGGEKKEFGETISVTATRSKRRTRDVPQAIAVVGREQIEDKVVFNVKDVVAGTPGVLVETKNGGYDARLLIRGAGLKANYGVREIMVLRDGVPLTDPDSLTRLDWVDMQDVERIEIAKGPGNLFSPGSAGGAVQILSRSVFDPGDSSARAALGTFGSALLHLRSSGAVAGNSLALSTSFREQNNDWRTWNRFSTRQVSLKHGLPLGGAGTVASEIAYTEADAQLPGAMDEALYRTFVSTGEQRATSEPWKHSGRYSRTLFLNSSMEKRLGALALKPRVYYNQWTHLHPVTGFVNETFDWTRTAGTDLEAQHAHEAFGVRGTLVGGLTAKVQWNDDVRRFQYRDVRRAGGGTTGRIVATLSDAKGALMETQSQRNLLAGAFLQETLEPHPRVLIDLGLRVDRSLLRVRQNEITRYDFAAGDYFPGEGVSVTRKTFDLPAPKAGLSVRVTRAVSVYASAARASQVPSESEIVSNPALDASVTTAYEAGVKLRNPLLTLDFAAYRMRVADEIVSSVDSGQTVFQNAGETAKRGIEATAAFSVMEGLEVGASYGYADYTYVAFTERVGGGEADRSGNRLPYVPRHQAGFFASWRHDSGLRLRVQSNVWGRYWIDNANTQTYPGYAFLTSVAGGWAFGRHELVLDVENAFDRRYAATVVKDANGTKVLYTAGTPRWVSLGYRFHL